MAKKRHEPKNATKSTQVRVKGLREKIALVERQILRKDLPHFAAGDTIKVHVRIKEGEKERIQIFEGVVIARTTKGGSNSVVARDGAKQDGKAAAKVSLKSFTVRKISHGVGVERIFLDASPTIAKVEIAQTGKVRRAKLYYLRGLEGKAAKIEREVETQASAAQKEAAGKAPAKS